MKPAIEVKHLWKQYRKGEKARYITLRDSLVQLPNKLFRRKGINSDLFWVLRDINLTINPGEVVGLIGRNGAGKSTLLKILSRITSPTRGTAILRGRLGSLLEVGTGFHFELTGRENIYLYGAVLGMRRSEINQKFDEIVQFAEVDNFLDTPLKHYSSGMYLRLAFAVAAHLDIELLLVDEILAVGDVAFQRKSIKKMEEVAHEGKTVIFVSHNMSTVSSVCERVVLLEGGKITADGSSETVIRQYLKTSQSSQLSSASDLEITKVVFHNYQSKAVHSFFPGENIKVQLHYQTKKTIEQPHFIVSVMSQGKPVCTANMLFDNNFPDSLSGKGIIGLAFEHPNLLPGVYEVGIRVVGKNKLETLFLSPNYASFSIDVSSKIKNTINNRLIGLRHSGQVLVPYRWKLANEARSKQIAITSLQL